jgi:hypothetical protein
MCALLAGGLAINSYSQNPPITCNRQTFDPTTNVPCDQGWPAATFCDNWGQNTCNIQMGAGAGGVPSWARGCTGPGQTLNNDCRTDNANNCRKKHFCFWDALGCHPGAALNPEAWYTEVRAYSANCVPHQ